MGDILPGFSFTGNAPNNVVTAGNLNALMGGATINPTAISAKVSKPLPVGADALLLWDSVTQTLQQVAVQNLVPSFRTRGGFSGLVIGNVGGANASELAVVASEIVMLTAGGIPRRVSNFSAVLNLAGAVGFNGPEAAGLAGSTQRWLYVWAISDGTNDGALFSASATSPTLPSGFIYSRLVGAWRLDNSSSLVPALQLGMSVATTMGPPATTAAGATTNQVPWVGAVGSGVEFCKAQVNGTAGQWSSIDLSKCCPPGITARVQGVYGSSTSGSANEALAVASNANVGGDSILTASFTGTFTAPTLGVQLIDTFERTVAAYGFNNFGAFDIPIALPTTPVIFAAAEFITSVHAMRITGFTLNL